MACSRLSIFDAGALLKTLDYAYLWRTPGCG
jgi:hypothetical protein